VYGDDLEDIIATLIEANYLNEQRYAISYTRGKFNSRRWGRNKIKMGLMQKRISSYCIKKGLEAIEEEEYLKALETVIEKSLTKNDHLENIIKKDKAVKYASSRGYEANLIFEIIRRLELEEKL